MSTPAETPKEEAKVSRKERKALLITALERGIVSDRMNVKLPDNLYGQWCRADPFEIDRLKSLGFRIDTEYAPQVALHSDGTSSAKVADTIHMICDREIKDIIDEIKHEQFLEAHAKPGQSRSKEEKDYEANVQNLGDIVPTIESKHRDALKTDVANALRQVTAQTQPQR